MTVSIGLGPFFSLVVGRVRQLMGWVGSGHTKWTHGQLWADCSTLPARISCKALSYKAPLNRSKCRSGSRHLWPREPCIRLGHENGSLLNGRDADRGGDAAVCRFTVDTCYLKCIY